MTFNVHAQTPRSATFESSAHLARVCTDKDLILNCGRYVIAVHDTIATVRALAFLKDDQMAFCIPSNTSEAQIITKVRKYFESHTSQGKSMAPIKVINALMDAYPCTNN